MVTGQAWSGGGCDDFFTSPRLICQPHTCRQLSCCKATSWPESNEVLFAVLFIRVRLFSLYFFFISDLSSDPWSIVTLAFFLRYPNPYASHVLSCDVISRSVSPSGSLMTTRLILKRGAMPRWFPKGIVSRAETWVVEETEVDPVGRTVKCKTKNLDHVKVMQVEETVYFRSAPEG